MSEYIFYPDYQAVGSEDKLQAEQEVDSFWDFFSQPWTPEFRVQVAALFVSTVPLVVISVTISDNYQAVYLMSTHLTLLQDKTYYKGISINIPLAVYTWNLVSFASTLFFVANFYRTYHSEKDWSALKEHDQKQREWMLTPGNPKRRNSQRPDMPVNLVNYRMSSIRGKQFNFWVLIAICIATVGILLWGFLQLGRYEAPPAYWIFLLPSVLLLFVFFFANNSEKTTQNEDDSSDREFTGFTPGPYEYARYTFYPMYAMWLLVTSLAHDVISSSRDQLMITSVVYAYLAAVMLLATNSRSSGTVSRTLFVVGLLVSMLVVRGSVVEARSVSGSNTYLVANALCMAALIIPVVELLIIKAEDAQRRLKLLQMMMVIEFIARGVTTIAVSFDVNRIMQ
jgi:hypothetical protein